jgi:hypothetical protein
MKNKKPGKRTSKITGRHVSIFVPAGDCILSSVIGSYKILNTVNALIKTQNPGMVPPFMVQLVGLSAQTNLYGGAFNICPHTTIDKINKTDIVLFRRLMEIMRLR